MKDKLATSVFKDGIGDLGNGCTCILNSVIGISGIGPSVVDSSINTDGNIIFGNDELYQYNDTCLDRSITLIFMLTI